MLRHAVVQFNRWDRSYDPGEIVSGFIKIRLRRDKVVTSFYAELTGQAKTCFPYGLLSCTGKEVYVQHRIYFIPPGNDDNPTELKAGSHNFYFDYLLPTNLPDSVMREWGKITYIIKFNIDSPRSRVYKLFREFYVKRTVGGIVPESSLVHLPLFANFWFNGGQILGFMELSNTAFKIGTKIPVKLLVRNHSNFVVLKFQCRLSKKIEYASTLPLATVRSERVVLAEKNLNHRVYPGQHKSEKVRLQIPNSFINLKECTIIKENFMVEYIIQLLGLHANICRAIPVQIVP